jgi:hypothetical protein
MSTNRNCRVIVNCFLDGRSSSNNSPTTKEKCLQLLKKVIEYEQNIESDILYDLIIINHNTNYTEGNSYIDSINNTTTKHGNIICLTTQNKGLSFDGYKTAFEIFKDKYDYWIFSEDDHILYVDNYFSLLLNEYKSHDNIGFLAFAPISDHMFRHSGGGFGLTTTDNLNEVIDKIGNLPCLTTGYDIRKSEVFFTHNFIKIGKELILQKTFSCFPRNHSKCVDHTRHRQKNILLDTGNYFFEVGE